jgi:hypothetical protein
LVWNGSRKLGSTKCVAGSAENVTMLLPEGHELIAGSGQNNIFLYYGMVHAMVLAACSFKLALCAFEKI